MHILARWQKAEGGPSDLEAIMKGLGMCIWSWPFDRQEAEAYHLCSLLLGNGFSYPHPELGVMDQPNLYYEFAETYLKARADYAEAHRGSDT